MVFEAIFDLETKSFFDETGRTDPSELGVSVVSVYTRQLDLGTLKETEGKIMSFWEADFPKMWEIFEKADRVIGFNSKRFDAPALKPYSPYDMAKLPHFDVLEELKKIHGKRVSLDRIAKDTLGKGKIDSGANAVLYWKSQKKEDLAKLQKYCEEDVIITKEIYDVGLRKGTFKFRDFWNKDYEVPVDFSYPADFSAKSEQSQMGLF